MNARNELGKGSVRHSFVTPCGGHLSERKGTALALVLSKISSLLTHSELRVQKGKAAAAVGLAPVGTPISPLVGVWTGPALFGAVAQLVER